MKKEEKGMSLILRSEDGFSVFSILIVLGVSAVMLGAMATFMSQSHVMRQTSRLADGRNSVADSLSRYGALGASLRNSLSLPGNDALKNCVLGKNCSSEKQDMKFAGPFPDSPLLAGDINSPVPYDSWGVACDQHSTNCPFSVTAQFLAVCNNGSSCSNPDSIQIFFSIQDSFSHSTNSAGVSSSAIVPVQKILAVAGN